MTFTFCFYNCEIYSDKASAREHRATPSWSNLGVILSQDGPLSPVRIFAWLLMTSRRLLMLCVVVVVVYLQFWMGKMRDVTPAALDDIYIHFDAQR